MACGIPGAHTTKNGELVTAPRSGFSLRDGINDDLARVADSFTYGTAMPGTHAALALLAAFGAAYVGIHVMRFIGFRTEFGGAVGGVLGVMALDVATKKVIYSNGS